MQQEVEPPWVKYPGYPPPDGFWRQSGEYWLHYVWAPFWKSLNSEEQESYLRKWNVPNVWKCLSHYLNPGLDRMWEDEDSNVDQSNTKSTITEEEYQAAFKEVSLNIRECIKQEKIKTLRALILWTAIFHPFIPMAIWLLYKNPLHMDWFLLFINSTIPLSLIVCIWKMWAKYLKEDYVVARYYCIPPFMVLFVVVVADLMILMRSS